ncbi:RNA-binding motif, single-stranded-interacting protein 3 [Acipenser ruthenus]|uniref:RNA-binding motif, single-stranded-interacting protein 3 n=1 Tax=Acipenser ruthenus TaxID=7906 RepID=A0A444TXG6_ACIRT|nr:RNA-binding motif, single-stranded-interacting protein 3 [Acipenser ruthenus]
MDEQELENMLKPFGHVISTRILRDANGVSRGVGFARFYSSPYSIATNRMIAQTSITPFIAASPVSTYQVQSTSWMPHQSYVMQPTGAMITPAMDHTMSMPPASMMGPLAQQMNHLSLGTTGTYMTAAAAASMQGTYIPQYTPVPPNAVPVEGVVTDASPQTLAPSSQDTSGQQQQIQVESTNEHAPAYTYQQSK